MKSIFMGLLLVCLPLFGMANGLTQEDLIGQYSLVGNGGFLKYDLSYNADGTAELSQKTMDGADLYCHGRFNLNAETQELVSVYNCESREVFTHKTSLVGVTKEALQIGISLPVQIRSSLGTDSVVDLFIKKK